MRTRLWCKVRVQACQLLAVIFHASYHVNAKHAICPLGSLSEFINYNLIK